MDVKVARKAYKASPYLRGITLSRALFSRQDQGLHTISAVPGHLAILLHKGTTLVVLDAVPASHQINASTQQNLLQAIMAKQVEATRSSLLVSFASSPIVAVTFQDGKLMAVQADSVLHCWVWQASEYQWHSCGRVALASGLHSQVIHASYIPSAKAIFWWETSQRQSNFGRAFFRGIEFVEGLLGLGKAESISFEGVGVEVKKLTAHNKGVWIWSGDPLIPSHLFHVKLMKVHTIRFPIAQDTTKHINEIAIAAAVYPATGEVLLLCEDRRVYVCALELTDNQPTISYLCTLASPTSTANSAVTESTANPITLFTHYNLICVAKADICTFYDIKSGQEIGSEVMPVMLHRAISQEGGVWERGVGGDVGVWNSNGIWKLQVPRLAAQAQSLASHGNLAAAELTRDWSLPSLSARFLFEVLMNENTREDEEVRRKAAEALLPYLQNPTLIVALLSGRHNQFVHDEVEAFIKRMEGKSEHGEENSRNAARTAFHYYTPLNISILPVMKQFHALNVKPETSASTQREEKNDVEVDVVKMNLGDIYLEMITDSGKLFNSLKKAFGLEKITEGMALYGNIGSINLLIGMAMHSLLCQPPGTKEDGTRPDYFELLCTLYISHDIDSLLPFVKAVHAKAPKDSVKKGQRDFFARALDCLPPLTTASPPSHVLIQAKLCCEGGRALEAIRNLLHAGWWKEVCDVTFAFGFSSQAKTSVINIPQAVNIVRERMDQDVQHFELFHVILTHALESRMPEKVLEAWEVMPRSYSVLELLRLIRSTHPPQSNMPILAQSGDLPLSIFQAKLLQLATQIK